MRPGKKAFIGVFLLIAVLSVIPLVLASHLSAFYQTGSVQTTGTGYSPVEEHEYEVEGHHGEGGHDHPNVLVEQIVTVIYDSENRSGLVYCAFPISTNHFEHSKDNYPVQVDAVSENVILTSSDMISAEEIGEGGSYSYQMTAFLLEEILNDIFDPAEICPNSNMVIVGFTPIAFESEIRTCLVGPYDSTPICDDWESFGYSLDRCTLSDPDTLVQGEQRPFECERLIDESFLDEHEHEHECNGLEPTVWVSDGIIHGGGLNGQAYAGQLRGTSGADVILGTDDNDTIVALGGPDTICSLGGDDLIKAGGGHDWIDSGANADLVQAQGGNDTIDCGSDGSNGRFNSDMAHGGGGTDSAVNCAITRAIP